MDQGLPTSNLHYQVVDPAISASLGKSEWEWNQGKQNIISTISWRKTVQGAGKNLEFSDQSLLIRALIKAFRRDIQLSVLKFYGR